jgi:UDP-N-acetylglucosamine diphosphorylase / glucose-1-phosphate thymidylyltransferase / UDP-N-acetylgalactosamine diphosphorylase / glucosamine-1-phosphate N-acetyltransferase / galactosamine-1-phosphate N-acetyltransferase
MMMQAVILAAGRSTRTYPLTVTRPKVLLPVLNRSILERNLDQLQGIVKEVIVVVGFKKEMIMERLGSSYDGLSIKYVEQKVQKGTGHALLLCEKLVKGKMLVMGGDDLHSGKDIRKLLKERNAALVKKVTDPERFGVYTVKAGRVTGIIEKSPSFVSDLANTACYVFEKDIFSYLKKLRPSPRGEIELTDAVSQLIKSSLFSVVEVKDFWIPIGYPWDLLAANEHLIKAIKKGKSEGTVAKSTTIDGTLVLGKGSVIKPGVLIEGTVVIGEHCEIGPNCYLRNGTTIGNHCKVGQAVEIKNSIIMDHTKIPHLSYVGDSVIGEHCNLGAGTITANLRHDKGTVKSPVRGEMADSGRRKLGTIIGDNVHTGINTSIYPGRKIWPNKHTVPGEAVTRDITE